MTAHESAVADVLVIGWGSSYGPIGEAVRRARANGHRVARTHVRHLNPLPANIGEVLGRYRRVLVPEMNLGQLSMLLKARFPAEIQPITKVQGMAFSAEELQEAIEAEFAGRLTHAEHDKYRVALDGVATTTGEPATRNHRLGTTATGTTTANRR